MGHWPERGQADFPLAGLIMLKYDEHWTQESFKSPWNLCTNLEERATIHACGFQREDLKEYGVGLINVTFQLLAAHGAIMQM